MGVFDRIGKGWTLGTASLKVIKENKQLLLFPLISGVFLVLVLGSFFGFVYSNWGLEVSEIVSESSLTDYIITFLFYLVSYFVIVFFNVGLVHCIRIHLSGGNPSFNDGVRFSMTRIATIFSWSVLAATVGLAIKAIQENSGTVGDILAQIVGVIWSIATFFVVPILAYEEVGPLEAVKRSGKMMKEKWGESIGASFSFGILSFLGVILIALPIGFLVSLIHPIAGITVGIMIVFFIQSIVSAAEMVFIATIYNQLTETEPSEQMFYDTELIDNLFTEKKKKGLFK